MDMFDPCDRFRNCRNRVSSLSLNEQINPPPVPKDLFIWEMNFPLWDKEKWWLTKVQVNVSAPFLQRATKLTFSEASAGCTFLQVECACEEGLDGLDEGLDGPGGNH